MTISPFVGKHVVVRTQSAGVFYGSLSLMQGGDCVLKDSRRIWYWSGAASLSQLSKDGTSDQKNCLFTTPVEAVKLTQVIEVLPLTKKAKTSLDGVDVWEGLIQYSSGCGDGSGNAYCEGGSYGNAFGKGCGFIDCSGDGGGYGPGSGVEDCYGDGDCCGSVDGDGYGEGYGSSRGLGDGYCYYDLSGDSDGDGPGYAYGDSYSDD